MNKQLITNMVLKSWYSSVKRTSALFDKLSDEEMLMEIAPDRNRGIYLLGHLAAVHDLMLPLLNLGEPLYPELMATFIRTPDNPDVQAFPIAQLRQYWTAINSELEEQFSNLSNEEWLQKHNSVSAEDFAKEPHRNRLNVLLSRTNHLGYHLGQLALLKSKNL